MQQIGNELGFPAGREIVRAYNRTGATITAGTAVVPDYLNTSGNVSGTRVDGPNGPHSNLVYGSTDTISGKSGAVLVCLSPSVANGAIGEFIRNGECDAWVATSSTLTALTRGARLRMNVSATMDGTLDAVTAQASQGKAITLEAMSGAFAGTLPANKVKLRILLNNEGFGPSL